MLFKINFIYNWIDILKCMNFPHLPPFYKMSHTCDKKGTLWIVIVFDFIFFPFCSAFACLCIFWSVKLCIQIGQAIMILWILRVKNIQKWPFLIYRILCILNSNMQIDNVKNVIECPKHVLCYKVPPFNVQCHIYWITICKLMLRMS